MRLSVVTVDWTEGGKRGVAAAEWVAMLNNDAVAESRWTEALVAAAVEGPLESSAAR